MLPTTGAKLGGHSIVLEDELTERVDSDNSCDFELVDSVIRATR
jgi:hypothetical protein